MGSWNKTCGLSNLHITAGTEVYVFVLEETTNKTDRCYTTSYWSPLMLPFNSVYNDYGGGENSSGPALNLVLNGIKNALVEMSVGENQYHDISVTKDGFGEEQFFNAVHENRLYTLDYHGNNRAVDFVMFRKDIVDEILTNLKVSEYVGENNGQSGYNNSYIEISFNDVLQSIPDLVNTLKVELGDFDNFKYFRNSLIDHNSKNLAAQYIQCCDGYRYSRLVNINKHIYDLIINNELATVELLLAEYVRAGFLDNFMHSVRKLWIPSGHEGSQTQDLNGYNVLGSAIQNAVNIEQAQQDE